MCEDIIAVRYVKGSMWNHRRGQAMGLRCVSNWWKVISLLKTSQPESTDWLSDSMPRKVRNGRSTDFCKDPWFGVLFL